MLVKKTKFRCSWCFRNWPIFLYLSFSNRYRQLIN